MYDELEQDGVRSDSRGGKATTSRRAKLSQSGNCNSPKRGESARALANTCKCNSSTCVLTTFRSEGP